jgi:hypothetical protein
MKKIFADYADNRERIKWHILFTGPVKEFLMGLTCIRSVRMKNVDGHIESLPINKGKAF